MLNNRLTAADVYKSTHLTSHIPISRSTLDRILLSDLSSNIVGEVVKGWGFLQNGRIRLDLSQH